MDNQYPSFERFRASDMDRPAHPAPANWSDSSPCWEAPRCEAPSSPGSFPPEPEPGPAQDPVPEPKTMPDPERVPTYCRVEAKPFPVQELRGISTATQEKHLKLYQGYVRKTNEIRDKLVQDGERSKADHNYSTYRGLKTGEVFNWNGVKLHDLFFPTLSGTPCPPSGTILEMIERDFGSFACWIEDFKACGLAFRGWAFLVYDLDDGRLHNFGGDAHDHGVWNCIPLLALDMYEHAFYLDYGPERKPYVDAILENMDWGKVNERLAQYGLVDK